MIDDRWLIHDVWKQTKASWWFQSLWKIWKPDWIIIPAIGEVIKFHGSSNHQPEKYFQVDWWSFPAHFGYVPRVPACRSLHDLRLHRHSLRLESATGKIRYKVVDPTWPIFRILKGTKTLLKHAAKACQQPLFRCVSFMTHKVEDLPPLLELWKAIAPPERALKSYFVKLWWCSMAR